MANDLQLQAIKARLRRTTRGPWDANGPFITSEDYDRNRMLISLERYPGWEFDAEFIASAPDDVMYLLDQVQQLHDQLEVVEAHNKKLQHTMANVDDLILEHWHDHLRRIHHVYCDYPWDLKVPDLDDD